MEVVAPWWEFVITPRILSRQKQQQQQEQRQQTYLPEGTSWQAKTTKQKKPKEVNTFVGGGGGLQGPGNDS